MIVTFPKAKNVYEGDLIALTKNDKFIGYGEVLVVLKDAVLVKVDKSTGKVFNEIYGEDIPCDMEIT
ncbi:MAG: hypothetical protein N3B21_16530 [Clostridia bacterium]|nr:hypothetical protein [Clostridia bacterium]